METSNKQTAVEWLIEQISSSKYFYNLMEEIQSRSTIAEPNGILQQAKEMEKQQLIEFAEFVATYPDKNRNVYGEMLHAKSKYDGTEKTINLLETFKSE
jgi:hypothetical protein